MAIVFTSWSGGKDCCFATYLAIASGLKVRYLANMVTEDGKLSWSHGLTPEILQVQAQAMGIPLVQQRSTSTNYETEFKNMVRALKPEGVSGGVFGDIDFNEHREWIERVCREAGVTPYLPLWQQSQDKILRDFINSEFEAVVVAARADFFGEEVLGKKVDLDFINYMDELNKTNTTKITPCGEAGEYHTIVVNGPLFRKRVELRETRRILKEERWFLEILKAELRNK